MARIGKPRRRRVWEGETRREWKRNKRADLEPGKFTRHVTTKEKKKAAKRAERLAKKGLA